MKETNKITTIFSTLKWKVTCWTTKVAACTRSAHESGVNRNEVSVSQSSSNEANICNHILPSPLPPPSWPTQTWINSRQQERVVFLTSRFFQHFRFLFWDFKYKIFKINHFGIDDHWFQKTVIKYSKLYIYIERKEVWKTICPEKETNCPVVLPKENLTEKTITWGLIYQVV